MYIHDLLIKARHNDMLRAAAQYRLAADARRARTTPRHHAITAPRQPGTRRHKLISRSASLLARKAQS